MIKVQQQQGINIMNLTRKLRTSGLASSLLLLLSLSTTGTVYAHAVERPVTGTYYDVSVMELQKFAVLEDDTVYGLNEANGGFTIDHGGLPRHGQIVWPHVFRFPPIGPDASASLFGGAFWRFDDGVVCSGFQGTRKTTFPFTYKTKLFCSDGSVLKLTLTDALDRDATGIHGVIEGVIKVRHRNRDRD